MKVAPILFLKEVQGAVYNNRYGLKRSGYWFG
jgi:hypothetical protein